MRTDARVWLPVDVAPKDGTPVLVCWRGRNLHPLVGHFEGDDATGQWGYLNADMSFTPFDDPPSDWQWLPVTP